METNDMPTQRATGPLRGLLDAMTILRVKRELLLRERPLPRTLPAYLDTRWEGIRCLQNAFYHLQVEFNAAVGDTARGER